MINTLHARHQARLQSRTTYRLPMQGGAVILTLLLAACGSNGAGEAPDGADGAVAPQPAAGGEPARSPATGDPKAGTGTIQIGEMSYDLTVTRCMNLAGAISGGAVSVAEPDNISVSFEFQPEDWTTRDASEGWDDMATVSLSSEDPYREWTAGASAFEHINLPGGITAQDVAVTSFDTAEDGLSVTGEARFIETRGMHTGGSTEPAAGTFSFHCPPKR